MKVMTVTALLTATVNWEPSTTDGLYSATDNRLQFEHGVPFSAQNMVRETFDSQSSFPTSSPDAFYQS